MKDEASFFRKGFTMRKSTLPIIAAATIAGFAVPASAQEVSVTISLANVDLARPSDVAALNERLSVALKSACGLDTALFGDDRWSASSCAEDGMINGRRIIAERRKQALTVEKVSD